MDYDKKILAALDEAGGLSTGAIASGIRPLFGHSSRTHSAFIRRRLLALQKQDLVRPMDDLKPVCWVLHRVAKYVRAE